MTICRFLGDFCAMNEGSISILKERLGERNEEERELRENTGKNGCT